MEYAENDLFSYIVQKNYLNENLAKNFYLQIILSIEYIHKKKISHRDIKPENILLDKDYNVKLCDYGWASYLTKGQFCNVFCGTPEYVSPEIVKKKPYNEKVDIWGIGVLIFELVFGYPPFSSNFNEERFNNIKERKINWPKDINDKDVKDLIENILKINPNERMSLDKIESHPWLYDTYNKMKENKKTNDTFENVKNTQTEIYKNNIMNNGISKLFNSEKKFVSKINSYNELENDGTFNPNELLKIYKMENKQLRLKILKVEEDNKNLEKKCCDYNDVCYLNQKLNKKIEENNKQILSLKSKCEQKDNIIKNNEEKIKELLLQNNEYKKLENLKGKYKIMEEELKNLKKLLEIKNINNTANNNNNQNKEEEIKIFLNNFLNDFKLENEKLSIYNQTKNSLIENAIKEEFNEHISNIKNIFEEKIYTNSKLYKMVDYLNNKIEELCGYKTKAERYQSQTEMLLNEQKILKEQIDVYRKIVSDSKKMVDFYREDIYKYKIKENLHKDIIKRTTKYIKKHFSIGLQSELFKLLEVK
jgi:hypothetical protein